jgi:hypothetical protein
VSNGQIKSGGIMAEKIDIAKVENAVKRFNEFALYKESEKIVDGAFSKKLNYGYTSMQKFILADIVLNANALRYCNDTRFQKVEEYIKKLDQEIGKHNKELERTSPEELKQINEQFNEISIRRFPGTVRGRDSVIICALSKYLHWNNPKLFPIYDALVNLGIKKYCSTTITDYGYLIFFYHALLEKYSDEDIKVLYKVSANNSCGYQLENKSILRIFDKYFWLKGKGLI